MCDTFIADFSDSSGYKLFGKNSDREPNEAQAIVRYAKTRNTTKLLQTTFITIPQVPETYEVILSKPFQMWGAEMGVNEHGVAIGNEAVFTKEKFKKGNKGLTGMDLLRLALERSDSAMTALNTITGLLEKYGQDACGGYMDTKFFYHNSFLIADRTAQYILETAGRYWVAKRVQGYAAISNGLFIGDDYDLCSDTVKQMESGAKVNFSAIFRDRVMSYLAHCDYRRRLNEREGDSHTIDVKKAIQVLSSHGKNDPFVPAKANMNALCIHASGLFTPHQTTGSMVVKLRQDGPITVWLSGTSAPCISLYMPFYFGGKSLSGNGTHLPSSTADNTLWWKGEQLHRIILKSYRSVKEIITAERQTIQQRWIEEDEKLISTNAEKPALDDLSERALMERIRVLDHWISACDPKNEQQYTGPVWYKFYRRSLDKQAGIA